MCIQVYHAENKSKCQLIYTASLTNSQRGLPWVHTLEKPCPKARYKLQSANFLVSAGMEGHSKLGMMELEVGIKFRSMRMQNLAMKIWQDRSIRSNTRDMLKILIQVDLHKKLAHLTCFLTQGSSCTILLHGPEHRSIQYALIQEHLMQQICASFLSMCHGHNTRTDILSWHIHHFNGHLFGKPGLAGCPSTPNF